jgi:hypothetical protein
MDLMDLHAIDLERAGSANLTSFVPPSGVRCAPFFVGEVKKIWAAC